MSTSKKTFDAVVVGSGACGGWAAKQLTEAGLNVLVLEAGRSNQADKLLWVMHRVRQKLFRYQAETDSARKQRQSVQSTTFAWPFHPHAFVDDVDNPYTTPKDAPFTWIRARQVGGRTSVKAHGRQFYRLSDFNFKAGGRDGQGPDWPLSLADLAPHYETVERWMGLHGNTDGLDTLPDSIFAASIAMNPAEQRLKERVERRWPERRVVVRRTAGAPVTIPAALKTGRLTLRTHAVVDQVLHDAKTNKVTGVRYIDSDTGKTHEAHGRVVILAAGTIETTRLMLHSKSAAFPEGLGNSSGQLGRNLMDHTYLLGIEAKMNLPASEQRAEQSWAYIPQFRNVTTNAEGFSRGYGVQVFTFGDSCHFVPFGEMVPRADNRVTLNPTVKDRWGIPAAHIECRHSDNELRMSADAVAACQEMMKEAGFTVEKVNDTLSTPGMAIHEVGTARMGTSPSTSVLNAWNQSWDVPNLFVMDGSAFPSQGPQNPTLTMMALAVRASAHLVSELKAGRL
ncbi:GMC family oxidoreductase [Myxococcus sp. K38C18041901]|uniref:GMC family oxidoreductase n=1 Tax=Myxococcus guangdongensis TaxID=2906760 RepID=UPI0020A71062|nr:GMC oxidoreductase [Myxococcus guangdongensis]MCP3065690.1 GMC family oxidoreductase [Myxococcus guangdongensis]